MKTNEKNGISLIVLILTIIVIIILATAVILSVANNNPIENAKEAVTLNNQKALEEAANLEYTTLYTNMKINNEEMDIAGMTNTIRENLKKQGFSEDEYNKVEVTKDGLVINKEVIVIKPTDELVAGDKVYYDTGNTSVGNEGIIECTVLYDKAYNEENGTNYGVQIISSDVIKDSSGNTVNVSFNGTGFEKMRTKYNNALSTLYNKAQEYLNDTYASSARCVGSDPADPDWDAGYYTKEIAEEKGEYKSFVDSYYGKLKNMDEKYITDCTQMDKIENCKIATASYWLASRNIAYVSATAKLGENFRFYIRYLSATSGNVYR